MRAATPSLLIAFVLIVCWGATAHGQTDPAPFAVTTLAKPDTGWVGLELSGPPGTVVALSEITTGQPQPLRTVTLATGRLQLKRAAAWRCDARAREFVAEVPGTPARATVSVRTPACTDRFAVSVRPRTGARVGRSVTVRVSDRWRHADSEANVCLRVRGASACRKATVPARGLTARLKASRAGAGTVTVRGAGFTLTRRIEVRSSKAPLRVLAAGDSMIQIVDSFLEQHLEKGERGTVATDDRIGTGISKSMLFDWVKHAQSSAGHRRPQATVMFIGANEGFAIGDAPCCGEAWVAAYARRVKTMMSAYRRGGLGRVYWLTLPTPRDPKRAQIYRAVNDAIKRAAADFPADEVSVIDLVPVFTPGGRYRSSMGGRTVRQPDGIHLNVAGARIAAGLIAKRLRADGLVS